MPLSVLAWHLGEDCSACLRKLAYTHLVLDLSCQQNQYDIPHNMSAQLQSNEFGVTSGMGTNSFIPKTDLDNEYSTA